MSAANARTDRFLNSLRENLTSGNYYESHQELRALSMRLLKQKNHQRALEFLYLGALELCQYSQWNSVSDLTTLLISIYAENKLPVTQENKDRVYDIFEKLAHAKENYTRLFESAIQWTVKVDGGRGDEQMHHFVAGVLRLRGLYKEAEGHYLVGTVESPAALGSMLFGWAQETDARDYGLFIARGVLKYLALGWYDAACFCWRAFISRMSAAFPEILVDKSKPSLVSKIGPIYYVNGAHEQVNFVQLVLLTVERSDGSPRSDSARILGLLRREYENSFGVNAGVVHDLMDAVAEKFFGVVVQRQQSLFDIVNSMFAPQTSSRPAIAGNQEDAMD
ncbi:hypothetical protein GGF37_002253 [Kickxella alabastrina]|nr:hypothetical protein GGF37_002253 [Kickxella alabastrina]